MDYAAGVPADDKNWPPFFPIIHHDIAKEIPVHAQRLQYLAFASWLGMLYMALVYMGNFDFLCMCTHLNFENFSTSMVQVVQILCFSPRKVVCGCDILVSFWFASNS